MSSEPSAANAPLPWRPLLTVIVLAVVAAVAAWVYRSGWRGLGEAASVSPQSPAASAPHDTGSAQIDAMTDRLAARLAQQGDDADGWAMLARSYAVMGRHAQAVPAFRKAAALRPSDPVLLADFADALAMTQQRRLDGEPIELVRRALAVEPENPKALSLAGTEAFDRQDWAAALRHWERLQASAPADHPIVRQVLPSIGMARARVAQQPASMLRSASQAAR